MAGQRAILKPPLPAPGDAFLMPLGDGRFGVCRVLRANTEAERKWHGCPQLLVAGSSWIGAGDPDLNDPQLREIQNLTHHNWKNSKDTLSMYWVDEPPPRSISRVGVIEPSPGDKRRRCLASGGWSFHTQTLAQWRWDHDREAVDREEAEAAKRQAREREEAMSRPRVVPPPPSLAALRTKRRFPHWKNYAPDAAIPASRAIFRETVDALLALGTGPSKAATLRVLRTCIERLNALDSKLENFIETTICEELCDEFDELARACGLPEGYKLAERWRDW